MEKGSMAENMVCPHISPTFPKISEEEQRDA